MDSTPVQEGQEKCYYTLGRRARLDINKEKPEKDGGFQVDRRWSKDGDVEGRLKFLKNLKLSSFESLEKLEGRIECPTCNKSCKFYCCKCMISMVKDTPNLRLPIKVTVISHPKEKVSKSSIIPAKVVASEDVEILQTTEVPAFSEPSDQIVLLFPADDAK